MDIAQLRKNPHLSASSVLDYLDCGLHYRFGRVDRLKPESVADSLVFGTSIHAAIEQFNRSRLEGMPISLADMTEWFGLQLRQVVEGGEKIRYKDGKNFDVLLEEGKTLLTMYYQQRPRDEMTVLGVEEPFSIEIESIPLPIIGVIDLIEEDPSGTIVITDYKTASKAYSASDIEKNHQLTLYQLAAKWNGYTDRNILLKFDCLIKTKTPKFEQYWTTRSEDDERRLVKTIGSVWKGITNEVFMPNDRSWKCATCCYAEACKRWFNE